MGEAKKDDAAPGRESHASNEWQVVPANLLNLHPPRLPDEFVSALRPPIQNFLRTEPRLPTWRPSDSVGEETRRFFDDLKIPSVNREPSLLLHELGTRPNPAVDTVFSGAGNR